MASRSGPQIIPRGGGGNATVPPDAPIQPAQAFVDNIDALLLNLGPGSGAALDLSNKSITSVTIGTKSSSPFGAWFVVYNQTIGAPNLNLSGNAIATATVVTILSDCVALANSDGVVATLNLSGQTPAAPPTLNCMSVAGAGTAAANGAYTPRGTVNGKEYYNLVGQPDSTSGYAIGWEDFGIAGIQWGITDSVSAVLYISSDDVATPDLVTTWLVAPSGSLPVPTVTSANTSKVQLVAAGWTVTTD